MTHEERWPFIAAYIVASKPRGTIYTGVTSDLPTRIRQHRDGVIPGFSKRYGCTRLVWYEPFEFMVTAIGREKTIKHWIRAWKVNLIEEGNPCWEDLYPRLVGETPLDTRPFERKLADSMRQSIAADRP